MNGLTLDSRRLVLEALEALYEMEARLIFRLLCPSHLLGEARKEWNRMSAELYKAGLFSQVDLAALADYCQALGKLVAVGRVEASR